MIAMKSAGFWDITYEMETQILSIDDAGGLAAAVDVLTGGGVVAFPTDTVYGLGAMAFDENAVGTLYDVKERRMDKAIPLLIGDFDQLELVTSSVTPMAAKLARHFWPGPLTIVLPRHASIPDAVTPLPTVGVRIPNLASTQKLLRLTGPLAVTSANVSGEGSPSTAPGVVMQLGRRIPLILDGGVTPGGTPSTVVDCTKDRPVILREGPISLHEILKTLA
jgi:L-threonylcarbamoyladenylate synthase